jgi:guanosine-3',5'-bis(diphosphate) 3'-pyrophosphohydrolase
MSSSPRIDSAAGRSGLVRGALAVARRAHAGQTRDTGFGDIPFIDHPLAVAELLAEHGYAEEVLAAALLHDVFEYTRLRRPELVERFGEDVAGLVGTLTEDLDIEPYDERKEEYRERVAAAGADPRAIFAADRTANVIVTREAYAEVGESIDTGMEVSLDLKILVWEYDLEMLFDRSPGVALVDRFAEEMVGLWGDRAAEERATLC